MFFCNKNKFLYIKEFFLILKKKIFLQSLQVEQHCSTKFKTKRSIYVKRREDAKAIFRVSSGNFLEMYDFAVYGFYAAFIAKIFFPAENEFLSIMQSFLAFGVEFLSVRWVRLCLVDIWTNMVVKRTFGYTYFNGNRHTYYCVVSGLWEYWGFGPIIVVIGRLLQGFSTGAEVGGASVYLAEIAPKHLRGFYVSWQSGSQQVATIFAGAIGVGLHYWIGDTIMENGAGGYLLSLVILLCHLFFILDAH